jgi:hypothetical protein
LAPAKLGDTNNVLIIEQSPRLPPLGVKRGHTTVVAGRRVSIRSSSAKSKTFVAQWNTSSARYIALANGTQQTVLERFIACLP